MEEVIPAAMDSGKGKDAAVEGCFDWVMDANRDDVIKSLEGQDCLDGEVAFVDREDVLGFFNGANADSRGMNVADWGHEVCVVR